MELSVAGFAVDIGLPVVAGLDMQAGEPAASTDVGIDIDSVTKIEWKVGVLLGGVPADHDFSRLMRQRGAEFFVN